MSDGDRLYVNGEGDVMVKTDDGRVLDPDAAWVERSIAQRYELPPDRDLIDALEPLMERITANRGLYAGNYPRDCAQRVVEALHEHIETRKRVIGREIGSAEAP